MASRSLTSTPNLPALVEDSAARPARPHHRMSTRNRLLFFLTAWLIVLMPFLFWWSTWFGRHLSDTQITEYLNDDKHPRHIQHALVQLGERMARQDKGAVRWYPQLLRLASHLVEEVRNTDAWVMGQDTSAAAFHETLLKMLQDSSPMVRGNAALSLVRFGDAASSRPPPAASSTSTRSELQCAKVASSPSYRMEIASRKFARRSVAAFARFPSAPERP